MMKKQLFFLALTILIGNVSAFDFTAVFWLRKQNCQHLSSECLPRAISQPTHHSMLPPTLNSSRQLTLTHEGYTAQLYWTLKSQAGEKYYGFQIQITDPEEKILAVCSRYESQETFENVPVGACGGALPDGQEIFGLTILLPQPQ